MKDFIFEKEEPVAKTPRMEVVRVTYSSGDSKFTHMIVKSAPSVTVIVRNADRNLGFIKQFRSTTGQYYIEVPAGCLNADESFLEAARREVEEETGLIITKASLLTCLPNLLDISKSDEDFRIVLADVSGKTERHLDETEQIDENIIWLSEKDAHYRLLCQLSGKPFYHGLLLSGPSTHALLTYFFLEQ